MKDKMKLIIEDFKKDKRKSIILGVSILIIIAIVILIIVFLNGSSEEEKLKGYMEEMGIVFYEELYYQQIGKTDEERKEFLKKFTELGIKINLDSLSRYKTEENQEKIDAFKNSKTNEECDKKESKVIVYPEEPFGQKDYRIEIILNCGFEE